MLCRWFTDSGDQEFINKNHAFGSCDEQKHFGYSTFRPLQREVISQVLKGRDCVVVMATGGGKLIWYLQFDIWSSSDAHCHVGL
jgi:superfamily II DNA or RNA helicase